MGLPPLDDVETFVFLAVAAIVTAGRLAARYADTGKVHIEPPFL
jgi:hypothetical protein